MMRSSNCSSGEAFIRNQKKTSEEEMLYTLDCRRAVHPEKGIYVCKGRKILAK